MTLPEEPATDVSVRQFVSDSGAVTRGLRQGRAYTLTLNGEPLARMVPIRRRRAIPVGEVFAIFSTGAAGRRGRAARRPGRGWEPGAARSVCGNRPVTVHDAGVVDTSIIAAI